MKEATLGLAYPVELKESPSVYSSDEHDEARWVTVEQLDSFSLAPGLLKIYGKPLGNPGTLERRTLQ
jgi:hypothetical protein